MFWPLPAARSIGFELIHLEIWSAGAGSPTFRAAGSAPPARDRMAARVTICIGILLAPFTWDAVSVMAVKRRPASAGEDRGHGNLPRRVRLLLENQEVLVGK